jgi:hypothetical protein
MECVDNIAALQGMKIPSARTTADDARKGDDIPLITGVSIIMLPIHVRILQDNAPALQRAR